MGKAALTVSDIRKVIDAQRVMFKKAMEMLDDLEAKLDGHESLGQEVKRVATAFTTTWEARYKAAYAYNGPKHTMIWKKLLRVMPPEEILRRQRVYFACTDPFVVKAHHSIEVFYSNINQYLGHDMLTPDEDFDCHHEPPCRSAMQHTSKKLSEAQRA